MCSISGFLSNQPIEKNFARRLASALLFYGRERGEQSAGVYVNGAITKKAIDPKAFIESSEFFNAFDKDTMLALCHTRQPTSGGKGDEQAQPFGQGETVTIHNGYFFDIKEIRDKWKLNKSSGVDSELITSFIDSYGVKRLPDFIKSTDGPSAIAAVVRGELFLAKAGNPLHYTSIKFEGGQRIIIFASTESMIRRALRYCLLVEKIDVKEAKEGGLFRVTPKRLKKIGQGLEPEYSYKKWGFDSSYSYGMYGHGYFDDNDMYTCTGSNVDTEKDDDETTQDYKRRLELEENADTYDLVTGQWSEKRKRLHEMSDEELREETEGNKNPYSLCDICRKNDAEGMSYCQECLDKGKVYWRKLGEKKAAMKGAERRLLQYNGEDSKKLDIILAEYEKLEKEVREYEKTGKKN